jgi:aminopeptidase
MAKGKARVHVRGQDTDLTLSIDGRTFINSDGHFNFPDGEFFTEPVEDSANDYTRYSFPASISGRSVEDVRLRFENGVVVEARAAQGQDFLDKMLTMDEGARRLGEFAFGNNPNIDLSIKNILFDEKIGGTVHLALAPAFQKRAVSTNRLCTGIWFVICAAAVKFALMARCSVKTENLSSDRFL